MTPQEFMDWATKQITTTLPHAMVRVIGSNEHLVTFRISIIAFNDTHHVQETVNMTMVDSMKYKHAILRSMVHSLIDHIYNAVEVQNGR